MALVELHEVPVLPDDSDSEDEEAMERNAFHIEEDLAAFTDEHPIRHNVCPESESESDNDSDADKEEEGPKSKKQRTRERDRVRRGNGNLFIGQMFFNEVAFKEAVLDYALKTGHNLKQTRYDKTVSKVLKRIMHCGICGAANHNCRFQKKNVFYICGAANPLEAPETLLILTTIYKHQNRFAQ